MKQSIDHQLTIYDFFVDNFLKHHAPLAAWRQSNNNAPSFTDAEVITLALLQSYFGCATLSQTYNLVRANATKAFPKMCGYQQWLARLHRLSPIIGGLVVVSAGTPDSPYYVNPSLELKR